MNSLYLVVIIISEIVFYMFKLPVEVFCILVSVGCLLALITWWNKNNYELIKKINICTYIIILIYIFNDEQKINFDIIELSSITLLTVICVLYSYFLFQYRFVKNTKKENKNLLIKRRKYDLERICDYIDKYNIVGINSEFGEGKSFITDEFIRKNYEKYEVIKINILSYNFDEFNLILVKELNKILKKHKIFSKASYELQSLLGINKTVKQLLLSFVETNLKFGEAISELKKDIQKIVSRKILVVFEDIDRIGDITKIKKVFSISELLSCDNIKILYHFDQNELNELGLDRHYVEKYIPYVVNLTQLNFTEVVSSLLMENEYSSFLEKAKKYLLSCEYEYLSIPELNSILDKHSLRLTMKLPNISIRKVRLFLDDCLYFLSKEEFNNNAVLKIVINILLFKHFFYEKFISLDYGINLESILKIKDHNGIKKNIQEVINEYLNLQDDKKSEYSLNLISMFDDNKQSDLLTENIFNCSLIALLHYKFNSKKESSEMELLNIEEHNLKINRLLWCIRYNGKSELTDLENGIKLFKEEVLALPLEKQSVAFNRFYDKINHQNLSKDNISMFYFGRSKYLPLFEGFSIYNHDDADAVKLIDFYKIDSENHDLNYEFVSLFMYCNIFSKTILIKLLHLFNSLNVIGDLSHSVQYKFLLKNIFFALARYAVTSFRFLCGLLEDDILSKGSGKDFFIKQLVHFKQNLENFNKLKQPNIKSDIALYSAFIDKNIQILSSKVKCSIDIFPKVSVKTYEPRIDYIHKQLSSQPVKKRLEKLNSLYIDGDVNIDQYKLLYNKYISNNEITIDNMK